MKNYAGVGSRIVAVIIDHIILMIITLIISLPFGALAVFASLTNPALLFGPALVAYSAMIIISVIVWILYFTYFEGTTGQTPGKKLVNIKVVKEGKAKMTMTDAFVRTILRIIDGIAIYILGLIVILVSEKNQRIGDMAAKTLVVKA